MFESIINFFKNIGKAQKEQGKSKDAAKERLHLVLMQDRANVSADFLDLMKQEIIEVIKKYIEVDENAIDVRLTNKANGDGTTGAPALYANIPIMNIKEEVKSGMAREKQVKKDEKEEIKDKTNKSKESKKDEVRENSEKVNNVKKDEKEVKEKIEEKVVEENTVASESKTEDSKEQIEVKKATKQENKEELEQKEKTEEKDA